MIVTPESGALLAAYADAMFAEGKLTPALDARAIGWQCVGYLTALNALMGAQIIGAGDREYYGFLAVSTEDPDCYACVVRGTEQPVEWLIDAQGLMIPYRGATCAVELGFISVYGSMLYASLEGAGKPLKASLGIADAVPAGARVTIIGHSLGAALATYLLLDVTLARDSNVVNGLLYASPKPGDQHFADLVQAKCRYTVYNYNRDLVPHAPPSLFGFRSLPTQVLITPQSGKAAIFNSPGCNHSALSYAALLGAAHVQNDCIRGIKP